MSPYTIGAIDQGYQVAKSVLEAEVWMVRYLGNVIGPISLELVERGIEAGKLPRGSEIAHCEHQQWRRLAELYPDVARAYSSPPPRPVPVPASAPPTSSAPPPAPTTSSAPPPADAYELPVVPPPPPIPPMPPPSYRFPEEPVSIPKQGVLAAIFG